MFYYETGTEGVRIIGNVSYDVTINEGTIDKGRLYIHKVNSNTYCKPTRHNQVPIYRGVTIFLRPLVDGARA